MKQLKKLGVEFNRIKKLEEKIGDLKNLEQLNIGNNQFGEIPVEKLRKLKKLKSITIGGNRFSRIYVEKLQKTFRERLLQNTERKPESNLLRRGL